MSARGFSLGEIACELQVSVAGNGIIQEYPFGQIRLLSNATTIDSALQFIKTKQQQEQQQQNKRLSVCYKKVRMLSFMNSDTF